MGAPIGNNNPGKARVWTQAINNVLAKRHPNGRMAALEDLAEKLIESVEAGDLPAIIEFGNRIEGKPAQSVMLSGDPDNDAPIHVMNRPQVSKQEWLELHGLGTAARPAD